MKIKITKQDFQDYVAGWLMTDESLDNLSTANMAAALLNASRMLYDYQDGVVAETERRKSYPDIS